ncbi:hypothetical protein TcCL_NonESM02828, partial [Trypanosoma cruzi]
LSRMSGRSVPSAQRTGGHVHGAGDERPLAKSRCTAALLRSLAVAFVMSVQSSCPTRRSRVSVQKCVHGLPLPALNSSNRRLHVKEVLPRVIYDQSEKTET